MRIVGQQWGHLLATSDTAPVSLSQTIQLDRRSISAEVAVSAVMKTAHAGAASLGVAKITQVVSSSGTEEPMLSVIGRAEATSITFTLQVFNGSTIARWIIHHWE